jgi:hypothetical protein
VVGSCFLPNILYNMLGPQVYFCSRISWASNTCNRFSFSFFQQQEGVKPLALKGRVAP